MLRRLRLPLVVLMFGLLLWLDRRPLPKGFLFLTFLAMYGVERFLIDFVRTYESSAFPVPSVHFTYNQWISIGVVSFALVQLARLRGARAAADA